MGRKDQIVETAISLLARKGVKGFTIRNLSQEVGVTDGAVYRHFTGKQAIMEEILGRFEDLSHFEEGQAEAPLTMIEHFLQDRYRRFEENPELARLLLLNNPFQSHPELMSRFRRMMHRHFQVVESYLNAGRQDGSIVSHISPLSLFRLIVGPFRLIVTQWLFSHLEFDLHATGMRQWQDTLQLIQTGVPHAG